MANSRIKSFKPGQTVLVREIWHGKVWSARPVIVVQDTPELLVLYSPSGTIFKQPVTLDGKRPTAQTRSDSQWLLADGKWPERSNCIRLTVPGKSYSVLIFLNRGSWYINLEDPLTRSKRGFDYMDQILDIIVETDLKTWDWKDEDEFQEAQDLGLISPQEAKVFRAEGKKALKLLQSGRSIFNGWEHWKPDPSWKVPVLPDGWDVV